MQPKLEEFTDQTAKLILADGTSYQGRAFGSARSSAGEVVFNTGMVGYPECFTDPSYSGQILILTYPLIGNYGVPAPESPADPLRSPFESDRVHIAGLVVSEVSEEYSHWGSGSSLSEWLRLQEVPGLSGIDTRLLTQKLREQGSLLGRIVQEGDDDGGDFWDPNQENLIARVSVRGPQEFGRGMKKVLLIDCGCKRNIVRSLVTRGVAVRVVPWDWNVAGEIFDGLVISNGPGDPRMYESIVASIQRVLDIGKPTFGICLGHQLLARAAGATTYKLKFGHRSQNQPCVQVGTKRCYITAQNHGYAVDERTLPEGWEPWFFNANDRTNEGIRHRSRPFFSVQFHPEASPGPVDTAFLFDDFLRLL